MKIKRCLIHFLVVKIEEKFRKFLKYTFRMEDFMSEFCELKSSEILTRKKISNQPLKECKVRCSSQKCNFEAPSSQNSLVEHCQKTHGWKPFPCPSDNCNFVAYNNQSSVAHKRFHCKTRRFVDKEFPCNWKGCKSSFLDNATLQIHLRIHTNDLLECVFCPYRTNQTSDMKDHYRFHFKMYDLKCDLCDKQFVSHKYLNRHYSIEHTVDSHVCKICNKYSGPRLLLQRHIMFKHNLYSKWNETKQSFETFTRDSRD